MPLPLVPLLFWGGAALVGVFAAKKVYDFFSSGTWSQIYEGAKAVFKDPQQYQKFFNAGSLSSEGGTISSLSFEEAKDVFSELDEKDGLYLIHAPEFSGLSAPEGDVGPIKPIIPEKTGKMEIYQPTPKELRIADVSKNQKEILTPPLSHEFTPEMNVRYTSFGKRMLLCVCKDVQKELSLFQYNEEKKTWDLLLKKCLSQSSPQFGKGEEIFQVTTNGLLQRHVFKSWNPFPSTVLQNNGEKMATKFVGSPEICGNYAFLLDERRRLCFAPLEQPSFWQENLFSSSLDSFSVLYLGGDEYIVVGSLQSKIFVRLKINSVFSSEDTISLDSEIVLFRLIQKDKNFYIFVKTKTNRYMLKIDAQKAAQKTAQEYAALQREERQKALTIAESERVCFEFVTSSLQMRHRGEESSLENQWLPELRNHFLAEKLPPELVKDWVSHIAQVYTSFLKHLLLLKEGRSVPATRADSLILQIQKEQESEVNTKESFEKQKNERQREREYEFYRFALEMMDEAELKVYVQAQYEKEASKIRVEEWREKAEIEISIQTEIDRRKAMNQIAFEKHRIQMFEDIKRLEIEIHQQLMEYEITKQTELTEWHRNLNQSLEKELSEVLETKVPFLLEKSLAFEKFPQVQEKYIERIFALADHVTESIKKDQEHLRDTLKDLSKRPQQLTSSLLELNRRMQISFFETKQLKD